MNNDEKTEPVWPFRTFIQLPVLAFYIFTFLFQLDVTISELSWLKTDDVITYCDLILKMLFLVFKSHITVFKSLPEVIMSELS